MGKGLEKLLVIGRGASYVIGFLDKLWKVLGWLGLAGLISSAAGTWLVGAWALIEGIPTSAIAVMVLGTFTCLLVLPGKLVALFSKPRKMRSNASEIPFYEGWDDLNQFLLWQVAYLWLDQEPRDRTTEVGTKEFVIMQMLIRDAESNILSADLRGGYDWKDARITRTALINYANRKKKQPYFLFPESRELAWMAR